MFIKQLAILQEIKESGQIKSSELRKRFLGIKERTFRYHLKRLADQGLIHKLGTTRGVYYEPVQQKD